VVITSMKCEWCGRTLRPDQALAYWPRSRPAVARVVCRPSTRDKVCFRSVVPGAATYAIALATQVAQA
jgi:hypothetical protein